jgi:hypothetical protein
MAGNVTIIGLLDAVSTRRLAVAIRPEIFSGNTFAW